MTTTKQNKALFAILLTISILGSLLLPFSAKAALSVTASGITPSTAEVGTPYSGTSVISSSGTAPYVYSVSAPSLGLTATEAGGTITISGTPTGTGTATFNIGVTDATPDTGSVSISVPITNPVFTTGSLPGGIVGAAYTATAGVTGGSAPYTFSSPAATWNNIGLSIDANGNITGTPTISGNHVLGVNVTDNLGRSQTVNFNINISGGLSITTSALPDATEGSSYSQPISSSGGTSPYSYVHKAGVLPAGIGINSAGAIIGTPKESGSFMFLVEVTDSSGSKATRQLTLRVNSKITPPSTKYSVISGAGQSYYNRGNLTYTVNAPLGDFESISFNGSKISSGYYSVKSGNTSTQIVFYEGFLKSLRNGTHSIVFNFSSGTASTNLYVHNDNTIIPNKPKPVYPQPATKPISSSTGSKTKPNEFASGGKTSSLRAGNATATVNGKKVSLDEDVYKSIVIYTPEKIRRNSVNVLSIEREKNAKRVIRYSLDEIVVDVSSASVRASNVSIQLSRKLGNAEQSAFKNLDKNKLVATAWEIDLSGAKRADVRFLLNKNYSKSKLNAYMYSEDRDEFVPVQRGKWSVIKTDGDYFVKLENVPSGVYCVLSK